MLLLKIIKTTKGCRKEYREILRGQLIRTTWKWGANSSWPLFGYARPGPSAQGNYNYHWPCSTKQFECILLIMVAVDALRECGIVSERRSRRSVYIYREMNYALLSAAQLPDIQQRIAEESIYMCHRTTPWDVDFPKREKWNSDFQISKTEFQCSNESSRVWLTRSWLGYGSKTQQPFCRTRKDE